MVAPRTYTSCLGPPPSCDSTEVPGAMVAISPPFNPRGGYFYHNYTEEETMTWRTEAQGPTAGKWQNWGSN